MQVELMGYSLKLLLHAGISVVVLEWQYKSHPVQDQIIFCIIFFTLTPAVRSLHKLLYIYYYELLY